MQHQQQHQHQHQQQQEFKEEDVIKKLIEKIDKALSDKVAFPLPECDSDATAPASSSTINFYDSYSSSINVYQSEASIVLQKTRQNLIELSDLHLPPIFEGLVGLLDKRMKLQQEDAVLRAQIFLLDLLYQCLDFRWKHHVIESCLFIYIYM
jgi:hypothetical protein